MTRGTTGMAGVSSAGITSEKARVNVELDNAIIDLLDLPRVEPGCPVLTRFIETYDRWAARVPERYAGEYL